MKITLINEDSVAQAVEAILKTPIDGTFSFEVKKLKIGRTNLQNRSLHLYFKLIANALNDAGIDQRILMNSFKYGFKVPNTEVSTKMLFQRIAGVIHGEDKTHRLSTKEIQQTYEAMDMGLSQKHGVHIPWPSLEEQMMQEREIEWLR